MNKILLAMVLVALGIVAFGSTMHGGTASAQVFPTPTIIPSGCFADATGNVVCGPNWSPPPGPVQPASCNATPVTCALVIQASAYGVKGDNATDNTTTLAAALTEACLISSLGGGATVQLPPGRIITGPQQLGCSNIIIAGYGPGYGGGTGQYPTAIPPATTLVCKSATATPLLLMMPSNTTEQTGNVIESMGFDGNTDACGTGLQVTGEQQPTFSRLTFLGFGTVAFLVKGGTIGGGNKGSVIHPHFQNMQFTQVLAGDGIGFELDGTTGGGDVFGASGDNFAFVQNLNPGMVFLRHDHDYFSNIQVTTLAGPTPSPAPDSIQVGCNSVSLYLQNVLVQNATHVLGNTSCANVGSNNPKGTVFSQYQSYENNSTGPTVDTGSTLVMSDDHGNQFYADNGNGTAPYICFGLQVPGGSPCANGNFFIANDVTDTNLLIGVRGSTGSGTGSIYFCPGAGCGPGGAVIAQSYIDPNGCYRVVITNAITALCSASLQIDAPGATPPPPTPAAGTILNGFWSGNSGYLVGITTGGAMTPVPSPVPFTTPSPVASAGVGISGSFPYTIGATGYGTFATTGNQNPSTGTTADTYVQVGSNVTGTTGVSNGPLGEWLAHVEEPAEQAVFTTTQFSYLCFSFAATSSVVQNNTVYSTNGSTCKSALTNRVAGSNGFGDSTDVGQGLFGKAEADIIIPNSTAWTAGFWIAMSGGTTSASLYVYGTVTIRPI